MAKPWARSGASPAAWCGNPLEAALSAPAAPGPLIEAAPVFAKGIVTALAGTFQARCATSA